MANAGTLEIIPLEQPLTLFVWSKSRVVPVRLTDFSITEEAFDPHLNPIRAKVSLGMRVLSVDDLGFEHPGGRMFMTYLATRSSSRRRRPSVALTRSRISGLCHELSAACADRSWACCRQSPSQPTAAITAPRRWQYTSPDGTDDLRIWRGAIVPQPGAPNFATVAQHAVRQGDRLDLIAAKYLGDPLMFWLICDANGAMRPARSGRDAGRGAADHHAAGRAGRPRVLKSVQLTLMIGPVYPADACRELSWTRWRRSR